MFSNVFTFVGDTAIEPIKRARKRLRRKKEELQLNHWQQQFAEKMQAARNALNDRFEEFADQALTPVFDEYRVFTSGQGLSGTALPARRKVRTFKFAMAENAYLLISFRLTGLRIDVFSESAFPRDSKLSPPLASAGMIDADEAWVRHAFERALDQFADAIVYTLEGSHAHDDAERDGDVAKVGLAETSGARLTCQFPKAAYRRLG